MINTKFKATGKVEISLNGEVVRKVDNLVVTNGQNYIVNRMAGVTPTVMGYMGVGSGNTAAVAADSQLETEVTSGMASRKASSVAPSSNTIQYVSTWAAGEATATLNEAGIFNGSSQTPGVDLMLSRVVFGGPITKGASDVLTVTWTITISAA